MVEEEKIELGLFLPSPLTREVDGQGWTSELWARGAESHSPAFHVTSQRLFTGTQVPLSGAERPELTCFDG